eukprot:COSAG05_NODE_624_length_8276_cov_4.903265_7_plen_274_part_00
MPKKLPGLGADLRLLIRRWVLPIGGVLLVLLLCQLSILELVRIFAPGEVDDSKSPEQVLAEVNAARSARYATMRAAFQEKGISVEAIAAQRSELWETEMHPEKNKLVVKTHYGNLVAKPYAPGAERFAALAVPPELAERAAEAARAVMAVLWQAHGGHDTDLYIHYTSQVFMHSTLYFHEKMDGRGRHGSQEVWDEEAEWWKQAAYPHNSENTGRGVTLVVEDLVVTSSGAVLLLLADPEGVRTIGASNRTTYTALLRLCFPPARAFALMICR